MGVLLNILMVPAILVGLFFNTMGVLGILRFPDFYTRLHADTKATTFGSVFTSLAVILWAFKAWLASGHDGQFVNLAVHAGFAVVVLAVTNATGAHALARSAYRSGLKPKQAVVDRMDGVGASAVAVPESPEALPAAAIREEAS
ncbi:MAG: monovalent cation/H(+) antiporter subunit G [Verrucomicrobiota bacterium]|jgi:multicomponent Na+:H+ antiporter subunit G|nr:monovalent cation/H(+) antiporter subunit G [Verrucomicrobiota bacterium]